MNNQIDRSSERLTVSGKRFPNIGGGWSSSRYNENDFIAKSRKIGVLFERKNSGHYKALLKDNTISDPLIISLHNPRTEAAKDICKYVSKYLIIKIGYELMHKDFENNKDFYYHENLLFNNSEDLEFEYLKNSNIKINRKEVIEYVKKCFLFGDKLNLDDLKLKCITKGK